MPRKPSCRDILPEGNNKIAVISSYNYIFYKFPRCGMEIADHRQDRDLRHCFVISLTGLPMRTGERPSTWS